MRLCRALGAEKLIDDPHAGMMAVAVSPSVQLAAVISSAFYSVWFLFTGGLLRVCHPVEMLVCLLIGGGILTMSRCGSAVLIDEC